MKSSIAIFLLPLLILTTLTPALGYETPSTHTYQVKPTNDLSAQVARLEQTVAVLQQQIALLQSVIRVTGTSVEISANRDLNINAGTTVDIRSGMDTIIKSSSNIRLQSSGAGEISAGSVLTLRGSLLRLNKATKPIATVGSVIGGNQVMTGSPTIFGE